MLVGHLQIDPEHSLPCVSKSKGKTIIAPSFCLTFKCLFLLCTTLLSCGVRH